MKQSIVKFLQFKGKNLLFLQKNGAYWIAIKPVCEALNIEYTRIFKNISKDAIFGPALAKQPMQVPGDQVRNMICLPEHLIYSWIATINSASKELIEYKKECFDILFNHFHGAITNRRELIFQKAQTEIERSKKEFSLRSNQDFNSWEQLKASKARIGKQLRESGRLEINEQIKLFEE